MTNDIQYLGLLDVSERIRRRDVSSEAVVRVLLERIARHGFSHAASAAGCVRRGHTVFVVNRGQFRNVAGGCSTRRDFSRTRQMR